MNFVEYFIHQMAASMNCTKSFIHQMAASMNFESFIHQIAASMNFEFFIQFNSIALFQTQQYNMHTSST